VFPSTRIAQLRYLLFRRSGNPDFGKAGYRLICGKHQLDPWRTFRDYNIVDGSTLHEVLTFGLSERPACSAECGGEGVEDGPCNLWCPKAVHMEDPSDELDALNNGNAGK
jgi:hypothetical protein